MCHPEGSCTTRGIWFAVSSRIESIGGLTPDSSSRANICQSGPVRMTLIDLFDCGDALEVGVGDGDLAGEAGMDTHVFQVGGLLRVGVQQGLNVVTLARIERVFGGPDRDIFYHQCFAISVKRVGHVWLCFLRKTCAAVEKIQYTGTRVDSKDAFQRALIATTIHGPS